MGSALPLREGKGTAIEGGVRVPCIMRWPGQIPAGRVCRTPMMTIDLLPTIAGLTGTQLPDHPIDGKDAWPLISGKSDQSPQDAYFFYYHTNELQGVRKGPWKLYFPHRYRSLNGRPGGTGGFPAKYDYNAMGLELYNLESDISETKNIAAFHPDIVRELSALGQQCREELGDALTGVQGSGNREVGRPKW